MPVSAVNQQTTPAVREAFPRYSDVFTNSKAILEENIKKIKKDSFEKSTAKEKTYINEVQNQLNKTNLQNIEKGTLPRENTRETQKITTGLFNPREVTNQKNVNNEMTSQTKEIPRVRTNEDIAT